MTLRIAGIVIPDNKRIEIALTYIYGIGRNASREILEKVNVAADVHTKDLKESEGAKIREEIESHYRVEGDLRRDVSTHIRRLKDIGCYRGIRHIKRLPVRGQRTRTNSRTVRGNVRKTAGSGRRAAAEKT
jgi:small subunit ribosomal protein S13